MIYKTKPIANYTNNKRILTGEGKGNVKNIIFKPKKRVLLTPRHY